MVEVHQATLDSTSVHMTHKRCSLHRQNRPHPCRYRTSTTSFWIVQHICFYYLFFSWGMYSTTRKKMYVSVEIWRPSSNIHWNIPLESIAIRFHIRIYALVFIYASNVKFCLLNNFMVLFPFRCTNLTKILLIYYEWIVNLHVTNYIFYILLLTAGACNSVLSRHYNRVAFAELPSEFQYNLWNEHQVLKYIYFEQLTN